MAGIDSAAAEQVLRRASDKAAEIGVAVCIAVVDPGAHLLAFRRMDGAILGAVDVAQRKARASALFPMDSGDFGQLIADEHLRGMESSNGGLACFPGGLPLFESGELVAAVGVSGATADQDRVIARSAAEGYS